MHKFSILLVLVFSVMNTHAQANINEVLLDDFGQGPVKVSNSFKTCSNDKKLGNCAAIALIKGALAQFQSFSGIFTQTTFLDSGIRVTCADGISVSITNQEIESVTSLSGMNGAEHSIYIDTARILYAIMCKRIFDQRQDYSVQCILTFKNAVEYLNSGFSTRSVYTLLGLKKNLIAVADLNKYSYAIIWCTAHAAYASQGSQDWFGKKIALKGKRMKNAVRYDGINAAFVLAKS